MPDAFLVNLVVSFSPSLVAERDGHYSRERYARLDDLPGHDGAVIRIPRHTHLRRAPDLAYRTEALRERPRGDPAGRAPPRRGGSSSRTDARGDEAGGGHPEGTDTHAVADEENDVSRLSVEIDVRHVGARLSVG